MTRKDIKIQNPNIFDAALSNIPNEIDNHSVDYTYNAKEENFDAANYNVPNVPIYSQALFPKYEEDRYGNLTFKQGTFSINLHAESQGELMDVTQIKVTTLIDTGCSKPILN